jgi:short-subunit dehydrogenase
MNTDTSLINSSAATNRMAMITGATGGLGKAFAVECASRGWKLFLTDLREDSLRTLARGLENAYGVEVHFAASDLTDPDSRLRLIEQVRSRPEHLWMLIHVAGTDHEGAFLDQTRGQILSILRLNIEAVLDLTHTLIGRRDPLSAFRIINVASLAAFYPMPMKATYAASKRFLLDFSLALGEEVRGMGATVTALCPAGLYTTPECIRAIDAQGLAGHLTAQSIGEVASDTLDCALKGQSVYIPGIFNRFLQSLGGWVPASWVSRFINRRWTTVREKRRVLEQAGVGS